MYEHITGEWEVKGEINVFKTRCICGGELCTQKMTPGVYEGRHQEAPLSHLRFQAHIVLLDYLPIMLIFYTKCNL